MQATQLRDAISSNWNRLTSESVPAYVLHYHDALKAQFETLRDPRTGPAPEEAEPELLRAYDNAKRIVNMHRDALGWTDLMLLDLSIVRFLSFECLRIKVAELRHRLTGCAVPLPPELSPKLESVAANDLAILRCEAESLINQVWQIRIARNSRDRYVGELRRTAFIGLLIIIAGLMAAGIVVSFSPLFLIILASGMIGALISILRRLQSAAAATALNLDQGNDLSALAYEKRQILISLVSGGVFATLLYVVFVAGLADILSDKLSPTFTFPKEVPEGGMKFIDFVTHIGPETGKDYAKVVIWSFVAGFFEQFVPDVLDRMAKREPKQG